MADVMTAASASALSGIAAAGQSYGKRGVPGVIASEAVGLRIISVQARRGLSAEVSDKVLSVAGVTLPATPKYVRSGDVEAIWTAPDQWLVASPVASRTAAIATSLAGFAAVTDQSDSRAVILLSGVRVRDVLSKGVMVDLHPRAFAPGDTAVTSIAHIGAQLSLISADPVFQLLVPRSFCMSFWDWLSDSAAEFGLSVSNRT